MSNILLLPTLLQNIQLYTIVLQGINPMDLCAPWDDYYTHKWIFPSKIDDQTFMDYAVQLSIKFLKNSLFKFTLPNDVYKSIYGESPSSTNNSLEYPITNKGFTRDWTNGPLCPWFNYYIHNWRDLSNHRYQKAMNIDEQLSITNYNNDKIS